MNPSALPLASGAEAVKALGKTGCEVVGKGSAQRLFLIRGAWSRVQVAVKGAQLDTRAL